MNRIAMTLVLTIFEIYLKQEFSYFTPEISVKVCTIGHKISVLWGYTTTSFQNTR